MDDILVYSKTLPAHVEHLHQVFQVLQQHKFYAKLSKCSFAQSTLEYLGHIISDKGVATDPEKTKVILAWPVPCIVTKLMGFLGLTGYYRKFVKSYGVIAKPLTVLLQKQNFLWTEEAQQAFDTLKQAMSHTHVLALPDFTQPFWIETDACAIGIGAVLMQAGHPVAYYSKALSVNNRKLSIYEKEFLAIMMAIDKWRTYLCRGHFVIKTNHQSLCHLDDQVLHTDLQKKAMTRLVGLNFTFQYKKGEDNKVADALFRVGNAFSLLAISARVPLLMQEVINSYAVDVKAQQLLQELAVTGKNIEGYELHQGLIKFHGKIWIGANVGLQTKLIQAFHSSALGGHSGIQTTYQRLHKLVVWPGIKLAVQEFVQQCVVCQQAKHENCKPPGLLQPLKIP
jgi:hypothetical protein